jgi:tetratricopeptide (TPR) repeat protein
MGHTVDLFTPKNSETQPVLAEEFTIEYPTYPVGEPERHPLFFEKRVYQGSSGKVYPLPFIDKVFDVPEIRGYRAVRLENQFVRVLLLPEIGGRVHAIEDKANDDYDILYHHKVIKPALVGLSGPWISGGIEFNWPQHHRPGTFMPVDWTIERSADNSVTVWMSDHDPLTRLKGMHGLRLTPDSSLIELRVRLFNRTPYRQTFLWWANAAVKVHDDYQSFFPPDVYYVADHAKRAISSFPLASGSYYGVDYQKRPGANDLRFYKNIPVPTSYMVVESEYGFLGGYDYRANGGFVHVADRSVAPGKKQWTWGNAAFGCAWDRELSDDSAPYIELMGGVYTDNQPDFSYLLPYETKSFSQFWWPIKGIGPVQNANRYAAIRVTRDNQGNCEIRLVSPSTIKNARLLVQGSGDPYVDRTVNLVPSEIWTHNISAATKLNRLVLVDSAGRELLSYEVSTDSDRIKLPNPATEPRDPAEINSSDELFLVGEHLEQYRHPTRDPETYWNEVIRRDSGDYRSRVALARRCIGRFQYQEAISHLILAIQRLTAFHPNPISGEAHYYLGVALRFSNNCSTAEDAFGKAAWDRSWLEPATYELGLLACRRKDFVRAAELLRVLELSENNHAAVLRSLVAWMQNDRSNSAKVLEALLRRDPLDHWAFYELVRQTSGGSFDEFLSRCHNDAQTILDLAFNYIEGGFVQEAIDLVELHQNSPSPNSVTPNPSAKTIMIQFVLAWLYDQIGDEKGSKDSLANAQRAVPFYFFPSRALEVQVLEWAITRPGSRRNAAYGLGNLYYDRRRHSDAIQTWEAGANDDPHFAPLQRNLGLAYFNHSREPAKAREAYDRALHFAPSDRRLAYEHDQLSKRLHESPEIRINALETAIEIVLSRDDFTVEYLSLLNFVGRHDDALRLMLSRRFHPWEGGEGKVLAQYRFARIALGCELLQRGDSAGALKQFISASVPPRNLGEEFHFLQSRADVNYWCGRALSMLGRPKDSEDAYLSSAEETQDFQGMAVRLYSSSTYYRGLSLLALKRDHEAQQLFSALREHAEGLKKLPAKIDYFATSLPNMLVFEDDLSRVNQIDGLLLEGLSLAGLGRFKDAQNCFFQVLKLDPSHLDAKQQLRLGTNGLFINWPAARPSE